MRCRPATRATPMLNSSSIRLRRRESVSLGRFQNCNLLEMDHFRRHGVEDEFDCPDWLLKTSFRKVLDWLPFSPPLPLHAGGCHGAAPFKRCRAVFAENRLGPATYLQVGFPSRRA